MVTAVVFLFQVLTLLLLSIPQALSSKAELEVPLLSPVFSLLFYLTFLVLSAVHVIVCTSTESSCYLCSLSWLTAGGVMVLVSALLCAVVSALTKVLVRGKLLSKVRLVPVSTTLSFQLGHFCYFSQSLIHQTLVKPLVCARHSTGRSREKEPPFREPDKEVFGATCLLGL